MADIVARLKLDNKDYEEKLKKAKASTKKFSQEGGGSLSDMMGKFTKLAGAVAASKAAVEVFNGVIKASQTVGDEYTRVLDSAKSVTNQFFYAISTGDFTTFDKGLKEMIKNAREATRALDDLGTNRIVLGYLRDKYQAGFQQALVDAKDKSLTKEERQSAYTKAKEYLTAYAKQIEQDKGIATTAIRNVIVEGGGPADVTKEQIDRVLETYNELGDQYKAAYSDLKRLHDAQNAINNMGAEYKKSWKGQQEVQGYLKEIAAINKKRSANQQLYKDAEVYNVLFERWQDETLQVNLAILQGVASADRELASWEQTLNRVKSQISGINEELGRTAHVTKLTGEQYAQSFGMGFYTGLIDKGGFGAKRAAAYDQATGTYRATIHENVPIIDTTLEEEDALPKYSANLDDVAESAVRSTDGLYALSDAMGSLSGMVDDNASQWLRWGASMLGVIGQIAPLLSGGGWGLVSGLASLASTAVSAPLGGVSACSALSRSEVRLRVQGSDLVGSISNYNNIKSRSYGG